MDKADDSIDFLFSARRNKMATSGARATMLGVVPYQIALFKALNDFRDFQQGETDARSVAAKWLDASSKQCTESPTVPPRWARS